MKSPKKKPAKPISMDHVVLEVEDVKASVEFYKKVLNFPAVRMKEFQAGDAPFASVRVSDQTLIDLFPRPMWNSRRRAVNPNHVCFTMSEPEVGALKRRLGRNGVEIIRHLPLSYGAQGWGNSIYLRDLNGVTLEARFYGKDSKKDLSSRQQRTQAKSAIKAIKASPPARKGKPSRG